MKYVLSMIILCTLYFLLCFFATGSTRKNMSSTNYYSYPDSVQEKIKADKVLCKMIPRKKNYVESFVSNLLLFTVVFIVTGLLLGLRSFAGSFVYFLIMGEGLNLFDLLIIDMCWWRHSKRVRISGIGTDAEYMDMRKHEGAFFRAIWMFALAALIASVFLEIMG